MSALHWLFLIFIAVPLLEIFLLLQVGEIIGVWPTVFMVVFTAFLGAFLVRSQGIATLSRVQEQLNQAQLPAVEMMEGVFILVAGALLLTPGFFTDSIGFFCLVPPWRRQCIQWLMKHFAQKKGVHVHRTHTIEGEYWRDKD